jgi:hypothetical protein
MTNNRQTAQSTRHSLQQAGLLVIGYIVLVFLLPASIAGRRAYHLSPLEYRTAIIAITLPSLLTWLVAFAGYAKLRQYVSVVRKSPEGPYFDKLANGCAWLAWSLPITSIFSLLTNAASDKWHTLHATSAILSNYLGLSLSVIAFSIIGAATRGLVNQAKLKFSLASIRSIMLFFLIAGVLYCYLIFRRLDLSSLSSAHNTYFLPIWLVVVSIIIPYLYAWFAGLLAVYEIRLFSRYTTGVLYRQALQLLMAGLTAIILSFIALQYITSVEPSKGHLVLGYRIVLISVFRIIGGGGFLLLAMGADRLKRIEEV